MTQEEQALKETEQAKAAKERRERIATACLAGMLANVKYIQMRWYNYAKDALKAADALIARLDAE